MALADPIDIRLPDTVSNPLRGRRYTRRFRRDEAESEASIVLRHLRRHFNSTRAELAGDFRRGKETVGTLELLVAGVTCAQLLACFRDFRIADHLMLASKSRAILLLQSGLRVQLHAVAEESFGAALLFVTGSRSHVQRLRHLALTRGLHLTDSGLHRDGRRLPCHHENDIYRALNLPWIAPELRENNGEVAAAQRHELPRLLEAADILGDLHVHTDASDGRDSLFDMVRAARNRGYEYIAITDHSRRFAGGINQSRLLAQMDVIDRLNEDSNSICILKSMEVDILEDGSLDLPDFILNKLDLVVGAVHQHGNLSAARQTERIIRAMDNRFFNVLAHPTGRLVGQHDPAAMDLEKIMQAARERNCALEINAQPVRLDLNDAACRLAKAMGVKMVLSTDAHSATELDNMRHGVSQARRGWLEADDILNTASLSQLKRHLQRRR